MAWVAGEVATTLIEKLSARQREVLQLASRGLTNQEIGGALNISVETVRTHIHTLIHRLGVSNRTEAAAVSLAYDAVAERANREPARPAIAVLPVLALSAEPRNTTSTVSLTRELAALFSRWCWFPVIATASNKDARALGLTSQEIGALLGARFLIDASLHTSAASVRITACVTDATNGYCVWTDTYDQPREAWPRMHAQLCQTIVAASYPRIIATVHADLPRDCPPESLDAWMLTQKAHGQQRTQERDDNALAQVGFRMALAREPTLVLAHFGLGLASYDEIVHQWGPERPARERLASCAERCVALAPHQAEGYYLFGCYHQTLGRYQDALAPLEQAVDCNPSFAAAQALLGQILLIIGRSDEGLSHLQHACQLDPRSFVAELAAAYFVRGEYRLSLRAAEEALAPKPRQAFPRLLAAAAAWWSDEHARAASHQQALLTLPPASSLDSFRHSLGDDREAMSRLAQALELLAARSAAREAA